MLFSNRNTRLMPKYLNCIDCQFCRRQSAATAFEPTGTGVRGQRSTSYTIADCVYKFTLLFNRRHLRLLKYIGGIFQFNNLIILKIISANDAIRRYEFSES